MAAILGWDIGGVNVKAALVLDGRLVVARSQPFEVRRAPEDLTEVLQEMHARVRRDALAAGKACGTPCALVHAVTMTAELARVFRTKRDGVRTVLDAVEAACAGAEVQVFAVDGRWRTPTEARRDWLDVAAANWSATARLVAGTHPDAVLVDTGSTTTDIIPIVGGAVAAAGRTDLDRLASGELVYTGAVRTPVEALAGHAVIHGRSYALAAEAFALAGDVHVWRGDLAPGDYTVETPDGRPATRTFAGERLRRALCADTHLMTDTDVDDLAADLAHAQVARVADAIGRIRARHPDLRVAVIAGLGAFIGAAAARRAGCEVRLLAGTLGDDAARYAPAAAVALLWSTSSRQDAGVTPNPPAAVGVADIVVKVGGSLVGFPDALRVALAAVEAASRTRRLVVVPGGGPMADAVRAVDRAVGLPDAAAHWMAVMAMDQYGEALASHTVRGRVVHDRSGIDRAIDAGDVPVLAPHAWLRQHDPVPHTWSVTSDSIAAWVAGEVGASRLVLIKAPGAAGELVDEYFARALPPGVQHAVVAADDGAGLGAALNGGGENVGRGSSHPSKPAIVVYQKPTCSTCRQVYAALRASGVDFEAVNYYTDPIPRKKLVELLGKMGMSPRDLLRRREAIYKTLELDARDLSDAEIIDLMVEHPDLIQRPIVEKGAKAILARPADRLKDIL
jgi:arsenate reductase (glutaredoxin)